MLIRPLNISTGINATDSRGSLAISKRSFQNAAVRQQSGTRAVIGQLKDLQDGLERLEKAFKSNRLVRSGSGPKPASMRGDGLSLSTVDRASVLRSTEDLNTQTTSYDTTSPAWTDTTRVGTAVKGTSEGAVTIGGTYTGDYTGDLTFESVRTSRTGGQDPIALRVYNEAGDHLETISWWAGDAGSNAKTTESGLEISVTGGKIMKNDTFVVGVDADDPIDVDPTDQLNDAAFEDVHKVIAGNFKLNGETISVKGSDDLNDILDRINSSGAGVTAELVDEQIILTSDENGSGDIVISDDKSGLIAALKLDGAVTQQGSIDERAAAMSVVDDFSGVSNGQFTINGETISIDTSDSLNDVLDQINSSGAGAIATLSGDTVSIRATGGGSLSLSGDTSGWLSAIGISEGTADPRAATGSSRGSRQASRNIAKAISALQEPLQALFGANEELDGAIRVSRLGVQSRLRVAIRDVFDQRGFEAEDNDFGMKFDLSSGGAGLEMSRGDTKDLQEALRNNPRDLKRMLFGSNQQAGLMDALSGAVEDAIGDLSENLSGSRRLSTYA